MLALGLILQVGVLASVAHAQSYYWIRRSADCFGTNGTTVLGKQLAIDDFCSTFSTATSTINATPIKHTLTGWCLAVANNSVTVQGTPVVLNTCTNNTASQTWTEITDGRIRVGNTLNCLAVSPSGGLMLHRCINGAPGGPAYAKMRPDGRPPSILIRHQQFKYKCAGGVEKYKKVLAINPYCSIFQVNKDDQLRNVASGFCADVFKGKLQVSGNASTIGIYNCNDAIHQKWTLGRVDRKIKVATTDKCLDIDWVTNKIVMSPCSEARLEWAQNSVPLAPPRRRFAPYTDVTLFNIDVGKVVQEQSLKYISFGFVVSDDGRITWGGAYDILPGEGNPTINEKVIAARSNGAEIIAALGGEGAEPATTNLTVSQLLAAYKLLTDFYNIRILDFTITGGALGDVAATRRRLKVIDRLQASYPNIEIIYTLPVDPTGFFPNTLAFLQEGINAGVHPSLINLIAFDFSTPQPDMAPAVILATESARNQTKTLGLNIDIGITTMIGVHDYNGIMTQDDAEAVIAYAKTTTWVRHLSFWSLNRDNSNINGTLDVSSQIPQTDFEFTQKFSQFLV